MTTPIWLQVDDDNLGSELWTLVDDGTDLYIKKLADGRYDLIEREDSRQPNAGYDVGPEGEWIERPDDRPGPGPFDTLLEAKRAYLEEAFMKEDVPVKKIKATKFEILGGEIEDRWVGATADSWDAIDKILWKMSESAPKTGAYDKTDFLITFEDGETYAGRYDLKHWTVETPSLRQHVNALVGCYAGRVQPPWTIERPETWERMKKDFEAQGWTKRFGDFMDKYDLGWPA